MTTTDFDLNIVGAVAATSPNLPPVAALGYEFVVAANGVFVRAESAHLRACVPVLGCFGSAILTLAKVEPYAELVNIPRVPISHLWSAVVNAREKMPNEAAYQFIPVGGQKWKCVSPRQTATRYAVEFDDAPDALIDLHSHNSMGAFFSDQDNADEQGFRLYCVLGRLDTDHPEIVCRVGVYGHFMDVPMTAVFDCAVTTPLVDKYKQL